MQHRGGFSGPAIADEEQPPPPSADAGGMQRHQSLHAGGECEDGKLDELIAHVIREPEQFPRDHDERRTLPGGHDGGGRAIAGAAKEPGCGQHREWAGLTRARPNAPRLAPGLPAAAQHQSDRHAHRRCRQAMPGQAVVGPADEPHQLRTLACKPERATEDLTVNPLQSVRALLERIDRDVGGMADDLHRCPYECPCGGQGFIRA